MPRAESPRKRRYRYHISRAPIAEAGSKQGWRLPAHDVEEAVIRIITAH